ncbi:conserved hypothetical protein [Ricinus communis]|uniref:Uncharacterized protein n=1 Tax=Ricinus communis TaxID=3988 RepID=B9SFQ8_RICCO|nr:conserved hypothetical protein [Ricinus communis]
MGKDEPRNTFKVSRVGGQSNRKRTISNTQVTSSSQPPPPRSLSQPPPRSSFSLLSRQNKASFKPPQATKPTISSAVKAKHISIVTSNAPPSAFKNFKKASELTAFMKT